INPHRYENLIFDKDAKTVKWKKESIFNKWCWHNWMATCRKLQIDPYLSPCTKLKSKWIKDLNINPMTLNFIEEKAGSTLERIGTRDHFLNITPIAQTLSATINQWDYMKLRSFCRAKDTITKTKHQPTEWEKIFINPTSDRGLISRIYKELKKHDIKTPDSPIEKWAIELNREFMAEEYRMAKRHLRKCSTSLLIRKMQIKTTLRYHLTPVRMAKIKNMRTTHVGEDVEQEFMNQNMNNAMNQKGITSELKMTRCAMEKECSYRNFNAEGRYYIEWIFLPNKQSKKLKTYVEKISDLILKGKLRLRQLAGIDPAEIVVPLTKEEIEKLWVESEPWQRACSNFLGEINSKYPKSDRIELIKRADWILPKIVRETPISGVCTFYTDANKQGKAGYKSEDLSKVVQSHYNSVQKSELYAILLVLMDFSKPLNIVTDSQYAERVVLHIETAEFIPDESELTSLFIQLQDIIRNRKHPLYITHIRSHTGLPGPLAQDNDEIDKLLIGNVLEASEFHKKNHVNSKGLKRDFSITWQQAKEIVRKCPTCSFYNQTPLPAGCNPKGTQRNDIWQVDVFHFAEFGKLKYVHHTIDTYSGFQWATALSSEKADSVITHLLEVIAIMGIPAQIKTDNTPAYVSGKMKQFFAYYNIKHITGEDKLWIPSKSIKVRFEQKTS
ncbi:hypothetical protein STEG23_024783, partial [Scotinomys teguina]